MEQEAIRKVAIEMIEQTGKKFWNITGEIWLTGVAYNSTHFQMTDTVDTKTLIHMIENEYVDDITSHYIKVLSGNNAVIYIWADTPFELWEHYDDKRLCIRYYEKPDDIRFSNVKV